MSKPVKITLLVVGILIVVGLVCGGIIAAIAVPNLLAARRAANENSAVSTLRTLHSAEITYQAVTDDGNFGTLAQLSSAKLIDMGTASGQKSHYKFTISKTDKTASKPAAFEITAAPVDSGGQRTFYLNEDGVIHYSSREGVIAGPNDPKLGDN